MRVKKIFATMVLISLCVCSVGIRWEAAEASEYKQAAGIVLPDIVYDREIEQTGSCGEGLSYTLDDSGLLTITGTGKIDDRAFAEVPAIQRVVIDEGVSEIGVRAFMNA